MKVRRSMLGGAVWAVSANHNSVSRIDPKTNTLLGKPILIRGRPLFVTVGLGAVWIGNNLTGGLERLDL